MEKSCDPSSKAGELFMTGPGRERRFAGPPAEVQRKLDRTAELYSRRKSWDIVCPRCGYRILSVEDSCCGIAEIYCRKCKFSGAVDLSMFRREKKNAGSACADKRTHR